MRRLRIDGKMPIDENSTPLAVTDSNQLRLKAFLEHTIYRRGIAPADPQCWWLLVRRHRDTGELAFYRCYSPEPVPLRELVRVAGRRWTVEESFQAGKGLAGLDEHQVRRWTSWRRWTLLAMARPRPARRDRRPRHTQQPAPAGLTALTCNEIHRLFTIFIIEPGRTRACPERWSIWRRRHQHRARASHYRRQAAASRPALGHNDLRLEY